MAMKSRRYEPPKHNIDYGDIEVDALITPEGKFLSVEIVTGGSEAKTTIMLRIPKEIVEREMNKF